MLGTKMWKKVLPVYSQSARHCRRLFDRAPIACTNRTICYSHPLSVKREILHKEIISKYEHEKANVAAAEAREAEKEAFSREKIREILEEQEEEQKLYSIVQETDMPVPNMKNPYEKPARKCVLCEYNVPIDYKNVRLLSQFVSLHTGRIYGRHITGLCLYMQRRIGKLINRSRYFGYMPYVYKNPQFLRDPKLFDPYRKGP